MKPFQTIDPKEWKSGFEAENGVIIDVRTAGEFEDSFIEGAKNIDINRPDFTEKIEKLDKETPYYVYCRSGARSNNAMGAMHSLGFKKVYNLEGGIMKWEQSGNEVEYGSDF